MIYHWKYSLGSANGRGKILERDFDDMVRSWSEKREIFVERKLTDSDAVKEQVYKIPISTSLSSSIQVVSCVAHDRGLTAM